VKLRLYHHPDGARIAYREAGTGPPLALLHSRGLSHREWEPIVDELAHRFRVVLPDLPLHGDSEDRPKHPYTPEWFTSVLSGFLQDACGPRPLVAGHEAGALLAVRAIAAGTLKPSRLVLMPSPLRDLVRHAVQDLGGNANRARSWAKAAKRWPAGAQRDLLDAYRTMDFPVLLLWADSDTSHPLAIAEETLDLLPDGQLRVLPRTGFLIAYDDPIGVARELVAFCG